MTVTVPDYPAQIHDKLIGRDYAVTLSFVHEITLTFQRVEDRLRER